jgi:hypothetical protein
MLVIDTRELAHDLPVRTSRGTKWICHTKKEENHERQMMSGGGACTIPVCLQAL